MQVVSAHNMGTIITCGDSNQVLLPFLDKSPYNPAQSPTKLSFSQLLTQHNLVDSLRESNPTKRRYTHTRIRPSLALTTYFLITGMAPEILTSSIVPIPWSDHNAVYTTIASTIPKTHNAICYLPDSMLKHPTHRLIIEQAIKQYLTHNISPDISPLTLWEAHKPVLHGVFQRQSAIFNRERRNLARKLESEFHISFASFQTNPTPDTKTQLDKARLKYKLFLTESADKSLRHARHAFYMKS